MANTCRAADLSMPKELRELMLQYVRDHTQHGDPRDKETWLDDDWFCLLEVAGSGAACPKAGDRSCAYVDDAGPEKEHRKTIPLLKKPR